MSDKVFHGCMSKNSDGTNRIIEKNFTCLYHTNVPFWKRVRDVDFRVRTRSKRLDKTLLSYRSLIGIADAEAAMILRVGCMQTIESFLNEHDSFIFKVIYWNT